VKEQRVLELVVQSKLTIDKLHVVLNRVGSCTKDINDDELL